MTQKLWLRIWLTVVSVITVLALLAGWIWRLDRDRERDERPGREIVVLNERGDVVGQAPARPLRAPGPGPLEFQVTMQDGQTLYIQLPRPQRPPGAHPPWWRIVGFGFAELMVFLAVAVALGIYPVVRWLTQRLERLHSGVERWGRGDLSARLPVQGRDEVAALAQRFNEAAERVEALVRSHKALLANASHELRSPLARIRMSLELLGSGDAARQQAQRTEIAQNIAELDQLIDEILLASRLDAPGGAPLQKETIDLTGLAAEECARTGAELHISTQPMLRGDPRLIRRLIRNLLENAAKYGHSRAAVIGREAGDQPDEAGDGGVQLWLDEVLENGVPCARIRVDDNGPGVPETERERIFEPFYRLSGASEKDGGVGLGLALVRGIALSHGGRVLCTGNPTGGARFVAVLPL